MSGASEGKTEAPHQPAAFINALSEEGTREELIDYLQKTWNERCEFERELSSVIAAYELRFAPSAIEPHDMSFERWLSFEPFLQQNIGSFATSDARYYTQEAMKRAWLAGAGAVRVPVAPFPFEAVGLVKGNGEFTVYERPIPDGEHIVYITRKGAPTSTRTALNPAAAWPFPEKRSTEDGERP